MKAFICHPFGLLFVLATISGTFSSHVDLALHPHAGLVGRATNAKPAKIIDDDDKLVSRCQMGTNVTRVRKVHYHMILEVDETDLGYSAQQQETLTYSVDTHMKAVAGVQSKKSRSASSAALLVAKARDNSGTCSARSEPDDDDEDDDDEEEDDEKKDDHNSKSKLDPKKQTSFVGQTGAPTTPKTDPKSVNNNGGKNKRDVEKTSATTVQDKKGSQEQTSAITDKNKKASKKKTTAKRGKVCFDFARKSEVAIQKQGIREMVKANGKKAVQVALVKTEREGIWLQTLTYPNGHVKQTIIQVEETLKYFTVAQFCKSCKLGEKYHRVTFQDVEIELEEEDVDFGQSLNCTGSASGSRIVKVPGDRSVGASVQRTQYTNVTYPTKGKKRPVYRVDTLVLGGYVTRQKDTIVKVPGTTGGDAPKRPANGIGGSVKGNGANPTNSGNGRKEDQGKTVTDPKVPQNGETVTNPKTNPTSNNGNTVTDPKVPTNPTSNNGKTKEQEEANTTNGKTQQLDTKTGTGQGGGGSTQGFEASKLQD